MNAKNSVVGPEIKSFEKAALSAFSFLGNYGFSHVETFVGMPDIEVRFQNSRVEVIVLFVAGSPPDVVLGQLALIDGRSVKVTEYSINYLLIERASSERLTTVYELGDPRLPDVLASLASLLEKYGGDILRGDFTVFSRLKELRDLRAQGKLPEFP